MIELYSYITLVSDDNETIEANKHMLMMNNYIFLFRARILRELFLTKEQENK